MSPWSYPTSILNGISRYEMKGKIWGEGDKIKGKICEVITCRTTGVA